MSLFAIQIDSRTVAVFALMIMYWWDRQKREQRINQSGDVLAKVLLPRAIYRNIFVLLLAIQSLLFVSGIIHSRDEVFTLYLKILVVNTLALGVALFLDANSYIEVREQGLVIDNWLYQWEQITNYTWLNQTSKLRLRITRYGPKDYSIAPQQKDELNALLGKHLLERTSIPPRASNSEK